MNKPHITAAVLAAATLLIATPAFALSAGVGVNASTTVAGTSANAKFAARISTAKNRADQEIERRITNLTDLNTKVQAMVKVSASEKAAIANEVTTEISNLTSLKAKIDADTDITTLKTDIQSIAKSYRIYMLIIPQGRIQVAADRIDSVADALAAFSVKLQTRISADQAAGSDVSAANTALADLTAKVADAKVQANAAVSETVSLTPDNGDTAKMQANQAALKDARAKIQAAMKDLEAARSDAKQIVQLIKGIKVKASATSSVSTQ